MSDTLFDNHVGDDGGADPHPTDVLPLPDAAAGPTGPAPAAPTPAATPETVTCPECGTVADVTLTRRESADFCTRCDYPLFWTPSQIQLGDSASRDDASLRRLPGTSGRVTVASIPCPHCAEANTLSALVCVRCEGPMVVAAPPPPVVVEKPAPPPPPPVPRTPVWVWAVIGVTTTLLVALVLWALLR